MVSVDYRLGYVLFLMGGIFAWQPTSFDSSFFSHVHRLGIRYCLFFFLVLRKFCDSKLIVRRGSFCLGERLFACLCILGKKLFNVFCADRDPQTRSVDVHVPFCATAKWIQTRDGG